MKTLLKTLLIAGALTGASLAFGLSRPAEAGIAVPALDSGAAASPIEQVHWHCGPWACHWEPNYRGPIPRYAQAWRAPHHPNCFWRRNYYGRWIFVCP